MKEKHLTAKGSSAEEAKCNLDYMIMHYIRSGHWIKKNEVTISKNSDGSFTAKVTLTW